MNARITKTFFFCAATHCENSFFVNTYEITLQMVVTTDDIQEQNIAMDRINYLFEVGFNNVLFINLDETKAIDLYLKANIRVCPLPEDPYDQIIGIIILNKCNAVTEEKIIVNSMEIKSKLCDGVSFYLVSEEGIEFKKPHNRWWNENNPCVTGYKMPKKDKIVELRTEPKDWNSVGLSWNQQDASDKGEIVFISVDK